MRLWLAILLTAVPIAVAAEVYRWVDEDGTVHYSDQPGGPGAEQMKLEEPQTVPGSEAGSGSPGSRGASRASGKETPARYRSLSVTKPTPEATVRDNQGRVQVSVSVEPPLRSDRGHRLAIYLDGEVRLRTRSASATLENVVRGEHELHVAILDDAGEQLLATEPLTFYMHQARITDPDNPRLAPQAPRFPGTTGNGGGDGADDGSDAAR